MHAQRTQEAVGFERLRAEDFGEFTATDAAMHFELPEAIARMHEAHSKRKIALRFGLDSRDAVAVNSDSGVAELAGGSAQVVRSVVRRDAAPSVDADPATDQRDQADQAKQYPFQPAHTSPY